MSKLEELIQQYCPDGVEYKTLGEATIMKRGTSATKGIMQEGDIPVISGGRQPAFYCNVSNRTGEVITVAGSGAGAGYVQYWNEPIFVCDAFSIQGNETLKTKYVYYILTNIQEKIYSTKKGGGVPHVHISSIDKFEIPVPPLPVQEEIVRILDAFTELQAELQKRLQQYNYYRDNLLSFEGRTDVQWKKLNEVATVYDGTHQTPAYKESGIPFISVENIGNIYNSRKYISREDFDKYKIKPRMGDVFMTRIGSIGVCAVFEKQADIAYYVSLALIRPNQDAVNSRYLKHIIESLTGCKELKKRTLVNAVPIKVNKDDIGKIVLPFPSLAEQQKIVSILDRFDSLTNDLTEGLPAEIEKRRQQYEYYRDKLLTFKRKGV